MKASIARGVRYLRTVRSRRQRPRGVWVNETPQTDRSAKRLRADEINAPIEKLQRDRVPGALLMSATEIATAQRIAEEVPEAAAALHAIVLAAAHRRARDIDQQ